MKKNTKTGYFWLLEKEENKIPGVLSINDGGKIELEIIGHFSDGADLLNNDDGLSRIIGHVEKDGLITLDDCFYIKRTYHLVVSLSQAFAQIRFSVGLTGVRMRLQPSMLSRSRWIA